ncbi:MAG: anaerobic sulfatase maturase [Spirochaetales bacterium]|nr:anaerobic sulfatase maturase [Spirochaetales bacterium]
MDKKPFGVIIKPVGPLCNLDCKYCFYIEKSEFFNKEKKLANFLMDDSILEEFTREYIEAQPDFVEEINFIWQGGEPSLAGLEFFKKAVSFQKRFNNGKLKISNSFQTNGTLLNSDLCKFLHDNNFLVGLSIDGPESLHNSFRVRSDGSGSFADVMAGVELLHRHEVEFNTMTMVHSKNVNSPERVYRFLKNIGSIFMQFIPCVEARQEDDPFSLERGLDPREYAAGLSSRSVNSMKYGAFLNSIFDIWLKGDIGEVFVQDFDNTLAQFYGLDANLCVYRENCSPNFVLEHNGDLFSCDHLAFERDRLGNICRDSFVEIVNSSEFEDFICAKSNLSKKCLDCVYLNLCHGGCPSNRIFFDSSGVKIDYLCDGHRLFYAHTSRYFQAMADALRAGWTASDYSNFLR